MLHTVLAQSQLLLTAVSCRLAVVDVLTSPLAYDVLLNRFASPNLFASLNLFAFVDIITDSCRAERQQLSYYSTMGDFPLALLTVFRRQESVLDVCATLLITFSVV